MHNARRVHVHVFARVCVCVCPMQYLNKCMLLFQIHYPAKRTGQQLLQLLQQNVAQLLHAQHSTIQMSNSHYSSDSAASV
jgi:hypothetical protein